MIKRHTFYVIYLPEVNWGDGTTDPGYFPNRGGDYVKDIGFARHYKKRGAKQILAKEKLLCPDGNAEIRKVEAVYTMEDLPSPKKIDKTDEEKKAEEEMTESRKRLSEDDFKNLKRRFGGDY